MPILIGRLLIKAVQIALPLAFDRQYSFDNFYSEQGDFVTQSLCSLIAGDGESMIGLWGRVDSGKTHLVNASAHFARQPAISFQLYDGAELVQGDPVIFEDLASCDVLAVDNLDALCGHRGWEQRFYQIINLCNRGELKLIFTTSDNPLQLDCELADFKSRLAWALLLQLSAATDETGLGNIIKFRAGLLGIDLSKEVIAYLLTHYSRRLSEQIRILRTLDAASLSAQKKISVPMIKQTLADWPV
jgi:DnaA family protein